MNSEYYRCELRYVNIWGMYLPMKLFNVVMFIWKYVRIVILKLRNRAVSDSVSVSVGIIGIFHVPLKNGESPEVM